MENGVIETTLYDGKYNVRFLGPTEDKPNRHMYYVNGKRKTGVTTYIGIKDKSYPLMKWKGELTVDFLLQQLEKGHITKEIICAANELDVIAKEEAADIGSQIHDWCEQYILAELGKAEEPDMPENENVQVGVNAFLDWREAHDVKFVSTERVVYSKKHDYIGKMDIEATINRKRALVDLKSSNSLNDSVNMQTEAYARADEEEKGKPDMYKERWAIRLPKYTEEEYLRRENRKKEIKRHLAEYKGADFKDYEIPIYMPFEAKKLDTDRDEDFQAFLAAKYLHEWNNRTDYFINRNK